MPTYTTQPAKQATSSMHVAHCAAGEAGLLRGVLAGSGNGARPIAAVHGKLYGRSAAPIAIPRH